MLLNIFNIKLPTLIIMVPSILIVYLSKKIYVLPKDVSEDYIGNYIYNKGYNRVFWSFVILQSIILLIFFLLYFYYFSFFGKFYFF